MAYACRLTVAIISIYTTILTRVSQLQRRHQDVEEDAPHESGEQEELRLEERVSVETDE